MSEKASQDYEFANFWRFNGNIIFKDGSDGYYDLQFGWGDSLDHCTLHSLPSIAILASWN